MKKLLGLLVLGLLLSGNAFADNDKSCGDGYSFYLSLIHI